MGLDYSIHLFYNDELKKSIYTTSIIDALFLYQDINPFSEFFVPPNTRQRISTTK